MRFFIPIRNYFKENWLAILLAIIVGFIYVAPNVFFIVLLGDEYQGIPMMQTANEDFYLARIQEVLDGHPVVASASFWEYKNAPPISPPVGEFFYALPSKLLGVSPVNVLIASRFFFPFILFLLVYALIKRLTGKVGWWAKLNAIAGGLFVLLGYDLIDYHTVWNVLIKGMALPGNFLIWTRPVNPIIGGLFLFAFLLCLLAIIQKSKRQKLSMLGGAIFLALMFGNYFFSWGIALSVWFALSLIYLIKRDYQSVKKMAMVVLGGLILAAPYWYASWQASQNPFYDETALRSGLFLTHYPLFNKLTLAVLAVYLLVAGWPIFRRLKFSRGWPELLKSELKKVADWQWICLAFLLGSFVCYSQQIITGVTIWPYHFVQYTIPLAIIVLFVLFYNVGLLWFKKFWRAALFLMLGAFIVWGSYNQINIYQRYYSYYKNLQLYAPVFDWLNNREKDCVVLVNNDLKSGYSLVGLVPAFTHCNIYNSPMVAILMPEERRYHNYLTYLRLQGITPDTLDEYSKKHGGEYRSFLYSNWKGLYDVTEDFPDFSDNILKERIKKVPEDYRQFYAKDFRQELEKYRLDYILSVGPLEQRIASQLVGIRIIYAVDNIYIYDF